jgi:hypothetical protein
LVFSQKDAKPCGQPDAARFYRAEQITLKVRILAMIKDEIYLLKKENASLKRKVVELEQKVAFHENHPTLAQGIKGESLIAKLIGGDFTSHNASHDLLILDKNIAIEVKLSRLNTAVRKVTSTTMRWTWANVLGIVKEKEYDYLILIGEADSRYKKYYMDKESPYVFFLIPREEVHSITISTNSGRARTVQLLSNPMKAKSSASKLFSEYQVTIKQLENKFEFKP